VTSKRRSLDEFSSLTPTAAARFLGVSKQTVYTWLGDGTLRSVPVPGFATRRIAVVDLERVKQDRAKRERPKRRQS